MKKLRFQLHHLFIFLNWIHPKAAGQRGILVHHHVLGVTYPHTFSR